MRLQAFGVNEPTSGTDTLALKTEAKRDGDQYVIKGQKIWTSRAEHSDFMLFLARTKPRNEVENKTDRLTVFLIDLREHIGKSISIRPIKAMINHSTAEVFLENVRIPASALVGKENKGFRYIVSGMNAERILIAAECIGDAKWFLEKGASYAHEGIVFGTPIGQNQGIQFLLAKAFAHMLAAEAIVQRAASFYDEGRDPAVEANTEKLLAAEASWEAAEACLQTHGGFGLTEEYDVERKFRETRLYQVAPISTNLILCYLAEKV